MRLKPSICLAFTRQLKQTAKLRQTALLRKTGFLKQLNDEFTPKSRGQWFALESTKFHLVSF